MTTVYWRSSFSQECHSLGSLKIAVNATQSLFFKQPQGPTWLAEGCERICKQSRREHWGMNTGG